MNKTFRRLLPLVLASLIALPVHADKGGKHGQGHGRGNDHGQGYDDDRDQDRRGGGRDREWQRDRDDDRRRGDDRRYFDDRSRDIISGYFGAEIRGGHCPPGLAKKNNGCMPPGQAKKWRRGYALPHDLARYPLPYDLLRRLPPPPRGHEYVRVAGDILLIAIGSAMVVDAIEDLVR